MFPPTVDPLEGLTHSNMIVLFIYLIAANRTLLVSVYKYTLRAALIIVREFA